MRKVVVNTTHIDYLFAFTKAIFHRIKSCSINVITDCVVIQIIYILDGTQITHKMLSLKAGAISLIYLLMQVNVVSVRI